MSMYITQGILEDRGLTISEQQLNLFVYPEIQSGGTSKTGGIELRRSYLGRNITWATRHLLIVKMYHVRYAWFEINPL